MGYSWFLKLALNCIDHLAWPLLALGYPLCASVHAIETDSYSETRDLLSYWILLSLIYLFEYAFLRLLSWFQFWPYIKLIIIFWLIIPDFGRASYVYNNLIRSCITVNPRAVISRLKNWRKLFVKKENFLLHAERYIQENGTEALEKLIASKITTRNIGVETTNTTRATNKKETQQITTENIGAEATNTIRAPDKKDTQQTTTHNISIEATYTIRATDKKETQQVITTHHIGAEATNTIRATDKKETQMTNGNKIQKEHKDIKDVEMIEKKEISAGKQDIPVMPNPSLNQNISSATKETNGMVKKGAAGGELPQSSTHKEVQKEWTCAVCQMITTCEKSLIMHLNGRHHKANCEALNTKNQPSPQKMKNDQSKEEWKPKNFINQPANVEQKNIQFSLVKEQAQTSGEPGKRMLNDPVKQSNCEALNTKNQPSPQKMKNDQSKEEWKPKNFINQPANVEQKNIQFSLVKEQAQTSGETGKMMLNDPVKQSNCEALNTKNQPSPRKMKNDQSKEKWKPKNFINQPANVEPEKRMLNDPVKQRNIKSQMNNSTSDKKGGMMNNSKLRCEVCNISYTSVADFASHIRKSHLAQIQTCSEA